MKKKYLVIIFLILAVVSGIAGYSFVISKPDEGEKAETSDVSENNSNNEAEEKLNQGNEENTNKDNSTGDISQKDLEKVLDNNTENAKSAESLDNEDNLKEKIDVPEDIESTVLDYLYGVCEMSEHAYNLGRAKYIKNWLDTNSEAWKFYDANGGKLAVGRAESIIEHLKLEYKDFVNYNSDTAKLNLEEIWTFENGDIVTFETVYHLVKTENKWMIQEIEMEDLKKYLLSYIGSEE